MCNRKWCQVSKSERSLPGTPYLREGLLTPLWWGSEPSGIPVLLLAEVIFWPKSHRIPTFPVDLWKQHGAWLTPAFLPGLESQAW